MLTSRQRIARLGTVVAVRLAEGATHRAVAREYGVPASDTQAWCEYVLRHALAEAEGVFDADPLVSVAEADRMIWRQDCERMAATAARLGGAA